MLPSAPLPWVSSQMTSPDVAHRGVLAVVAAGEVVAATAARAAAQATAALRRLENARPGMACPLCSTVGPSVAIMTTRPGHVRQRERPAIGWRDRLRVGFDPV